MNEQTRRQMPKPTFGYFRDGAYHSVAMEPSGPEAERTLPLPPERDPVAVAAEFSELLRADQ